MIATDIPPRPWHTVGVDLFHLDGMEYLLIADYYSKFPFVRKLGSQMGSTHVITLLKQIFSEQGIPQIVRSDNGPQFASHAFTEFRQSYGLNHITSSPHYPRSNGFYRKPGQKSKGYPAEGKEGPGRSILSHAVPVHSAN